MSTKLEDLIPHKQRVSEVLKSSRAVVNAERRVSRRRKDLDAAENDLRQARRALRVIIGDSVPGAPENNIGELPESEYKR